MEAFPEDEVDPSHRINFDDMYLSVDIYTYESDEPIDDFEYDMQSVIADAYVLPSNKYDERFHQLFSGQYSHIIVHSPDRHIDYFVMLPENGNPNVCLNDSVNLDGHYIIRLDDSIFDGVPLNEPKIDIMFNDDKSDGIIYFYGLHKRRAKFTDGKLYLTD